MRKIFSTRLGCQTSGIKHACREFPRNPRSKGTKYFFPLLLLPRCSAIKKMTLLTRRRPRLIELVEFVMLQPSLWSKLPFQHTSAVPMFAEADGGLGVIKGDEKIFGPTTSEAAQRPAQEGDGSRIHFTCFRTQKQPQNCRLFFALVLMEIILSLFYFPYFFIYWCNRKSCIFSSSLWQIWKSLYLSLNRIKKNVNLISSMLLAVIIM